MKIVKKKMWLFAVVALLLGGLSLGCDDDGFDDAPAAHASAAGGDKGEGGSYRGGAVQQGGSESAGAIPPGVERPPNHPTLAGDSAQPNGDGSMGMPTPQVERPEMADYGQEGPIRWDAPEDWEPKAPSNDMRFAEYTVSGSEEAESAELTVFFFGPGGGGGVDANLERWAGQFGDDAEPTRQTREVAGMKIHTLDVAGTYDAGMGMGAEQPAREDQRLLGAIAETSAGLFFFRLLGSRDLVTEQAGDFDAFVGSLHEEPSD